MGGLAATSPSRSFSPFCVFASRLADYNVAPRMICYPDKRPGIHYALLVAGCLGCPAFSAAQGTEPRPSIGQSAHDDQTAHPGQTSADAAVTEYPSLRLSGFGNVDFAAQDKSEGPRGFSEGQFVLHLASALSPRVNFFGELSFTPRSDAGTSTPGTPPATGFNAEVERMIIRLDQSDRLKVSFGRYH